MNPPFPTRAEISAGQLDQLRTLLAEIFPGNAFYSRKLQAAGLTFDVASLEDFSRRFPFTTKTELVQDQIANAPYGTNLTYSLSRYTRYHQTSGTSGQPLRWLDTPESWDVMLGSWTEVLRAAAVKPDDRVYFAFSFGPFIGFWLAFESAARMGCLCLPGGGLGSVARLRAMLDNQVSILCCTPTYALHLAAVAGEEKIELRKSGVRTIVVAGEAGGSAPAVRERIETLWGARVFDHHGMTEAGPVTHECPSRPGVLHVIDDAFFAEVLHPASGAVPIGETGELVLTTLGRIGSPLLRYRTGDVVRLGSAGINGQACACGRSTLTLDGGILGRLDDMVVIRGVNVFPAAVDEIIQKCGQIVEYQVKISSVQALPQLSIDIEPAGDCKDVAALKRELDRDFQAAFSLRISINDVPRGTLPRSEMKARRWLRI